MIISYPIQLPYVMGKEQRIVPDSLYNDSESLSGSYPMGKNRFWHGGIHIHPSDRSTPIRAIADGVVVAYRYDEVDTKDEFFNKTPYSRSFVLLKHETELGQTSLGVSKLVFYSLYMHLRAWSEVKDKKGNAAVQFLRKTEQESVAPDNHRKHSKSTTHDEFVAPTANGTVVPATGFARVHRGDVLGYCGSIPDNFSTPSRGIHFEIFFDDTAFLNNPYKVLWGKCVLIESLTAFEELLERKAIKVDKSKPASVDTEHLEDGHLKINIDHQHYWTSEDQFRIETTESPGTKIGLKKKFFPIDTELKVYDKDPTKNIYKLPKGTLIVPWCAPWLNANEFREHNRDGKLWSQVYIPEKNRVYWAEKSNIKFKSDADWPDFYKVEESGRYSSDGFIDDEGVQKLLDSYEKDRAINEKRDLANDEETLRHLICKHPTEWSKHDLTQRFERVTQDAFGSQKLNSEQFEKLVKHIERLSFWDDVPGLPNPKNVWHAHPIKFIEHIAGCIWLDSSEISALMPETDSECITQHKLGLNKTMLQWGFNTRLEQAHYLAQGIHESGGMKLMTELPSKYASSASIYKGRGFVQITSKTNYGECNTYLNKNIRTVNLLEHPEILGADSYLSFAASCWYWRTNDLKRSTIKGQEDSVVDEVGRVVNCGPGKRNHPESQPVNRKDRLEKFHWVKNILLT